MILVINQAFKKGVAPFPSLCVVSQSSGSFEFMVAIKVKFGASMLDLDVDPVDGVEVRG